MIKEYDEIFKLVMLNSYSGSCLKSTMFVASSPDFAHGERGAFPC